MWLSHSNIFHQVSLNCFYVNKNKKWVSLYVETWQYHLKLGIRILGQNNKENVDFTETKSTFCLGVAFERPF